MTSEELLLMLVMDILDHKKASDVVNYGVLISRVVVDSILVFSIVTDGMFEL